MPNVMQYGNKTAFISRPWVDAHSKIICQRCTNDGLNASKCQIWWIRKQLLTTGETLLNTWNPVVVIIRTTNIPWVHNPTELHYCSIWVSKEVGFQQVGDKMKPHPPTVVNSVVLVWYNS